MPDVGVMPPPVQDRIESLPWWRRPRHLRRQLAAALVITALLAVATFGGLNFVAARELLVRGTEELLAADGASQAITIEAGGQRLVAEISVTSSAPAVAAAVDDFTEQFGELDEEELSPEQRAELDTWYQERVIDPLVELGLGPLSLSDMVPVRPAAQWVQYHYTVRAPGEPPPVDAGDGTGYTDANVRYDDLFRTLSDSRGGGDVLLIDSAGTIVYSLDKRIDVGTNLETGPYADTALGQVVTERLPRARVGTTLLTDFSVTPGGRAALFAVSAVRSGPRLIGALAIEIPVSQLNAITELDDESEADTYIVASDLLLQSEPRAWLEDPEGYLAQLRAGDESDQKEADLIEFLGSPVGVQVIDTPPVQAALDGEDFDGASRSFFGDPTYTSAQSFSPAGRQWVVVTEAPRSSVSAPLREYLFRIVVVLAIILPIVAALGIWLSRLFTRPIRPTVEAAQAIVDGDRDPDVDTSRRDEFGDLGRRLSSMAESLAAHEAELADEYERTRQLLLAVLPPQLVDADGRIVGTGETVEPATAVAVILAPTHEREDQEGLRESLALARDLADEVAGETGVERVRVGADRYLYLAGLGTDEAGADAALEFVTQLRRRLLDEAADVSLDIHAGLSSGMVATGVFDTGSLTFGAWGEPVRRALALSSLARVDRVLVDATAQRASAPGRWPLADAHDVVGLDGEPMELFTLSVDDSPADVPS
jgi:class 3 adenylate cyclase